MSKTIRATATIKCTITQTKFRSQILQAIKRGDFARAMLLIEAHGCNRLTCLKVTQVRVIATKAGLEGIDDLNKQSLISQLEGVFSAYA